MPLLKPNGEYFEPPKKKYATPIAIRQDLYERARQHAKETGVSITSVISDALIRYFETLL